MNRHSAFLTCILIAFGSAAHAQQPSNISDGELALLPQYCRDRFVLETSNRHRDIPPLAVYWISKMGQSFWAMHHYCWAKINQRRIFATESATKWRMDQLVGVIGDLGYVLKNSPPDFIMLPEIYSALGEVELLRKNPAAAIGHFNTARKLKPSYPPPYQMWSEYLLSTGKNDEAKALLKVGLEHNSTAVNLQVMYKKLGGDPKTIVPVDPPAALAPAASQASTDPAAPPASAPALPAEANSSPESGTR